MNVDRDRNNALATHPEHERMIASSKWSIRMMLPKVGFLLLGVALGGLLAPHSGTGVATVDSPLVASLRQNYPDDAADWLETHQIAIDIATDTKTPGSLVVEPRYSDTYKFTSSGILKIVHSPSSAPVPDTFHLYLFGSEGLCKIVRVRGRDMLRLERIVIDSFQMTFDPPIEPIKRLDLSDFWYER